MEDRKITISWDDIEAQKSSEKPLEQSMQNGWSMFKAVLVLLVTFFGIGIAVIAVTKSERTNYEQSVPTKTIHDVRKELWLTINEELKNPACRARKIIEDAHVSVDVKYAQVMSCDITTMDGSENAGRDNSNIKLVVFDIKFVWDGFFHKDGYSVLRLVFDMQAQSIASAKIIDTDAVVNVDDPMFWFEVGCTIGTLLIGSND